MNVKTEELTKIELAENQKIVYQKRKILNGLISWWVQEKVESMGKDLIIETAEEYDRIIFNGKSLTN